MRAACIGALREVHSRAPAWNPLCSRRRRTAPLRPQSARLWREAGWYRGSLLSSLLGRGRFFMSIIRGDCVPPYRALRLHFPLRPAGRFRRRARGAWGGEGAVLWSQSAKRQTGFRGLRPPLSRAALALPSCRAVFVFPFSIFYIIQGAVDIEAATEANLGKRAQ